MDLATQLLICKGLMVDMPEGQKASIEEAKGAIRDAIGKYHLKNALFALQMVCAEETLRAERAEKG